MSYSPVFIFASAIAVSLAFGHAISRFWAPKQITPQRLVILLATLSTLFFAQHGHGAVIVGSMQEPFDYPSGTVVDGTTSLNGGTGWNATGSSADPNLSTSA